MNAETRARIVALAERLGYRPSQPARALVRGRSDLVGLIWDTAYESDGRRHPFLQDLLTGLKRTLGDTGHHLLLLTPVPTGSVDSDVEVYLRTFRQHRLAGVLLMGVDERHPTVTALVDAEVPCVGLDLEVQGPRATYVTSDNRVGAAHAVRHLHELGHTRIATITGPLDLMPAVERLAGYRYELARLGLPYRPDYVTHGDFFLPSGSRCARELLDLPEPPTAVFVAGDEMAIGAVREVLDAGRTVPGDLAIVGFDDVESASLIRPALTTVAQDREALAVAAVEALHELIALPERRPRGSGSGEPEPTARVWPAHRIVGTRLVVRSSCGAPTIEQ